jgi:hypothetical protein
MANRWYTQFYGSLHKKPVQLDCNFVVDSTNGNGLGIRSLKGPGISNVFMHTSPAATTTTSVFASGATSIVVNSLNNLIVGMTVSDSTTGGNISGGTKITGIYAPANQITLSAPTAGASAASPGDTLSFLPTLASTGNPNPAAGIIIVQFQDNFNRYYFGTPGFVSPVSGTPINVTTGLTQFAPYVIVSVGTTTLAAWQALGLPVGITPAVGVSFIAATASAGTGTGIVEAPGISGISSVEVIGDPNLTLNSGVASVLGSGGGSYIMLQCLAPTSSSVTTLIPTAPANGSVVGLSFFMSNSFITIQGE